MNAPDQPVPAADPIHEGRQRIVHECWQVLVGSVRVGRPMTLPNLIRLYRRRAASVDAVDPSGHYAADLAILRTAYLQQQPFRLSHAPRSSSGPPQLHGHR